MTVNEVCEACGQTLPPAQEDETCAEPEHAQEPAGRDVFDKRAQGGEPASLDGFNSVYEELVKQLSLSARVKLSTRLQKAGIARDAVGDSVLLPLQAAVAAQVRRRAHAKANSAAKRQAAKKTAA